MAWLLLIPVFFYLEIRIFLWVAGFVGFFGAAGLSILAALIGLALVRVQGFSTLLNARHIVMQPHQRQELTGRNVFDAACLAVAGLFFIIPGFLTDILAVLLLFPKVRGELYKTVTVPAGPAMRRARGHDPDVIEGEYTRLDE